MNQAQKLTKRERRLQKKLEKRENQSQSSRSALIRKLTYGAIALGAIILVGLWAYSRYVPVPEALSSQPVDTIIDGDWAKGNETASAIIVEYSDFQCPACKAYAPIIKELTDKYQDQLVFVYRHFPLKQIHLQAELAAQASEAAGNQGKFWEMHDLLFANQEQWAENPSARSLFLGYAQELGLDLDRFRQDLNHKDTKVKVKADYLSALKLNLNSTPTFFINGAKVENNPRSVDEFIELLGLANEPAPAPEENQEEAATGSAETE